MSHCAPKHVILLFLAILSSVTGKYCPGKCVKNADACTSKGGKVLGYCTNEMACCDYSVKYIGSCGTKKFGTSTSTFISPEYPAFSSGDLTCEFSLSLTNLPPFSGLLVEFEDVYMDGHGFSSASLPCDNDMLLLKGFPNFWRPPPRCGNLTGYSAVIDVSGEEFKALRIVAVMSSQRYKWRIRVRTLTLDPQVSTTTTTPMPSSSTPQEEENRLRRRRSLPETRVVNGVDKPVTSLPWQASIRIFYSQDYLLGRGLNVSSTLYNKINQAGLGCALEGKYFCGGSIISERHILTAAHCFDAHSKIKGMKNLESILVFVGETDLCQNDEVSHSRTPQNLTVEKVIFHYAYDRDMVLHDMVVLRLKETIEFKDYVKPIEMSPKDRVYVGQKVEASGWGRTNLTEKTVGLSMILQSISGIQVENASTCDKSLSGNYREGKKIIQKYPKYKGTFTSVLCITMAKNDSAAVENVGEGDSGGPLVYYDEEQDPPKPVLIGVTSFALNTRGSDKFKDYFQNVSYYRNWIDLAMLA